MSTELADVAVSLWSLGLELGAKEAELVIARAAVEALEEERAGLDIQVDRLRSQQNRALMSAADTGDTFVIKALVGQDVDIDRPLNPEGETALMRAAEQ